MSAVGGPLDPAALSIYVPEWAHTDESPQGYATVPHIASSPSMASPWSVVGPEIAYWDVRQVSELWKT